MSDTLFIGDVKIITTKTGGIAFIGQLQLNDLWDHLKKQEAKVAIREFQTRDGKTKKSVRISAFPLKEANTNEFKTHTLQINTYVKPLNSESDQVLENTPDDLPF